MKQFESRMSWSSSGSSTVSVRTWAPHCGVRPRSIIPRSSSFTRFLLAVKMSSAKNVYMLPLWTASSSSTRPTECVRNACPYMPGTEQNVHENGQPREVAIETTPPGFQPSMSP
ncbi:MAG: hypothetical protein A2W08_01400 [Candidatus Rokubacteria bacterium RBG_16_73_20]|nr:MAG: hypothetical protein A2W08_01400 [Candidatus Rokubacteria bacterium RBG_16_73_20]